MKLSVIITLYKNLPFLDMVLRGLERQTVTDFELIIAEDDNAPDTIAYLKEQAKQMPFSIRHISQEDCGFRKNEILNKAVIGATGEFLVFLDGDCIPHPRFISEYLSKMEEGLVFAGRRLMMSEVLTKKVIETKKLGLLSMPYQVRYGSKNLEEGVYLPFYQRSKSSGLIGCSWAILKKHLLEVNGFDEDYMSYGVGEDVDLEWRLVRHGIQLRSMRHRAIVYHMHHRFLGNDVGIQANYAKMKVKQELGCVYCVNGLDKHLPKK